MPPLARWIAVLLVALTDAGWAQPVTRLTLGPGLGMKAAAAVFSRSGDTRFSSGAGAAGAHSLVGSFGRDTRAEIQGRNRGQAVDTIQARRAKGRLPPIAAPCADVAYLVFFDWDSVALTKDAEQILSEFAMTFHRMRAGRLEVGHHPDRSGTPEADPLIAQRRGEVIAAALVSRGIHRDMIVVSGIDETRPLVETYPGAHEPQNRRVELIMR